MLWGGQNRKTLTQVESDWQKGNLITHHKRNTTAVVIYDLKVGNIFKAKLRQKDLNCYFISYWQSATINIFLSFLVTYHSLLFLVSFCLSVFLIYFVIVWSFLVILMHSLILHYGWRQPLSVNEKVTIFLAFLSLTCVAKGKCQPGYFMVRQLHFWDPLRWYKMCFEFQRIKFQWKNGSKFSHLLMVRAEGAEPPLPPLWSAWP